ncbi:MAG: ribosomal protein methyltransferase [Solirubrobacterales bacterium]|nr:ribosomal protein methyltransferase [Solirubrobacterales bacterium]
MIRLAIRCRPELAEQVLAELTELAPNGLEEEHGDGYVEYAIYGPPGELPAVPEIQAVAGEGLVSVSSTEIPDDWADRWRDFHTATEIAGGRIVVRPPWDENNSRHLLSSPIEVVIDPGQAFGTGAHATTALCLELLLDLADAGAIGGLADWGTGSGVLAIAAAKLGFAPVRACDHELAAVEAAAANAAVNHVELEVERLNLREAPAPFAPTAVANLTAPILLAVAEHLDRVPGALVASGMLHAEVDAVAAAFGARGLAEQERRTAGDWSALLLRSIG